MLNLKLPSIPISISISVSNTTSREGLLHLLFIIITLVVVLLLLLVYYYYWIGTTPTASSYLSPTTTTHDNVSNTASREGLLCYATPIHLLFIIITLVVLLLVVYYYYWIGIKVNNTTSTIITPTTTTATASSYLSPTTTTHNNDDDNADQTMHLPQDDTTLEEADAKYAQELQLQEASQTSTSTHNKARPSSLSSLLQNNNNNIQHQMCRICLETQEYWQMFTNTTCSHSFCYDCTRNHATTKILEKISTISCPELNCNCMLDFNSLRLIVPKHILIKWDQVLCESTILESHKFYCPFADCSALLINDDSTITQNNCPVCKRSICAACHVPWHSEFTCKEFGKLNMTNKKGEKDYEKLAVALAKKNKWKKCPNCKFFVEKAEGCVHITCRCKYEFCYDCGQVWTSNHCI